jgi:hypothetical protein
MSNIDDHLTLVSLIVAMPLDSESGRHVIKLEFQARCPAVFSKDAFTHVSGSVERKISRIQAHVRSQTCGVNRCPHEMTKFSKQFVPDLARISLSKHIHVKITIVVSLSVFLP